MFDALSSDADVTAVVDQIGERPAATGTFGLLMRARSRADRTDVLVKVNAPLHERAWLTAMYDADPAVTPRVYGSGENADLGLGWVVLERLAHQPPGFAGAEWYESLLRTAVRWQAAAGRVELEPLHEIDATWLTMWIDQAVGTDDSVALRRLRERFDDDWEWVRSVCPSEKCHGDVHFFNAGMRTSDASSMVLFDPIPRLAPWAYDAANCHALTNYMGAEPLVVMAGRFRRELGLDAPADDVLHRLSELLCAWLAVMWRTHFGESQPDRRQSSVAHIERAV